MKNYRLEGLTRHADELIQELKEHGLLGSDIEVIGALLFTKFKGEDKRISEMLDNTLKTIQEAEALLERLKNNNE
jgi:hypothetical protein